MCLGTFTTFYSCGHVTSTPSVCLQDVDPHYRCEPRGLKITQPNGRCVECYARGLTPDQHLKTTVRFTPDPLSVEQAEQITPQSSFDSTGRNDAIIRWVMDVPAPGPGTIRIERELRQQTCSIESALSSQRSSIRHEQSAPRPSTIRSRRTADPTGYEADDDDDSLA